MQDLGSWVALSFSHVFFSVFLDLLVLGTIIFTPFYSPNHREVIQTIGVIYAEHVTHLGFFVIVTVVYRVCPIELATTFQPKTLLSLSTYFLWPAQAPEC